MPPGVQPGPRTGGGRDARKHSRAAAEEQRLQADHAARLQESAKYQLDGPEKLTGAHDPQQRVAEKRRLGGLMVHG